MPEYVIATIRASNPMRGEGQAHMVRNRPETTGTLRVVPVGTAGAVDEVAAA